VGYRLFVRTAVDEGLYVVPARLAGFDLTGGLFLELTGLGERLQRRRYPRAPMDRRPCTLSLLNERRAPVNQSLGFLVDLSAGGAQVECVNPPELGALIRLSFRLDAGPRIEATLSVLGVQQGGGSALDNFGSRYRLRTSFAHITAEDRERVFRYVMARLRDRRGQPQQPTTTEPRRPTRTAGREPAGDAASAA
jgi:hypothetical protein